ncbi:MAG: PcsB-like coiled-coil domain-containing protein [Atopobiaceae bacterium]
MRSQISQEQAELKDLTQKMQDSRTEIDVLESDITDLTTRTFDLQNTIIQDREQLNQTIVTSYKEGAPNLLNLVLSSTSLEDMVSRIYYAQKVSEHQAAVISRLNDDKQALGEQIQQISEARTQQQQAQDELASQYDELASVIARLEEKASELEEEERAQALAAAEEARRAAEEAQAKKRAEAEAASKAAAEAAQQNKSSETKDLSHTSTTDNASGGTTSDTSNGNASGSDTGSNEGSNAGSQDAGNWITCVASAYSIADNDPPGSTATASGIPLDDSKPTVALPISQNPRSHYGDLIEIRYNNMSVIAMVTDCGYMGGGSRGLDLSTAVYRAFGFSNPFAWGLRTVSYRYL